MSVGLNKRWFYSRLAMISLLLVTAHASPAQQSASMPNSSQARCTEIAVLDAVRNPIHFEVRAAIRLKEVIARVGGLSARAGKIIRVVHSCKCGRCSEEEKAKEVHEYSLVEVLRGRESENPKVNPGDIVVVPETELVYVMGNAHQLTKIIFREGLRVTQAIAMAGETGSGGDLTKIEINRVSSEKGYQNLIVVSLKAIKEHRAEDVVLRPRDLVVVSDGGMSDGGIFSLPRPIWDPLIIPRDYRAICNMPRFRDLQPKVCQFVP